MKERYSEINSMTADLAVKAVENAYLNVPDPSRIILHSDYTEENTMRECNIKCVNYR